MIKVVLDTDIFSEVLKGKNASVAARAEDYLKTHEQFCVSVVTVMEIVKGLHKRGGPGRLEIFLSALNSLDIIALSTDASIIAGKILADLERAGQVIGRADPLIAGICIHEGMHLATGNLEHYRRVQVLGYPLVLEDWRNG